MNKPCGTYECAEYVEACGGEPSSPSDYICWGCGSDGPMCRYYNWLRARAEKRSADDDSDEE